MPDNIPKKIKVKCLTCGQYVSADVIPALWTEKDNYKDFRITECLKCRKKRLMQEKYNKNK